MKFIGNKSRVSNFLVNEFSKDNVEDNYTALDLFSGTGSVSKMFSELGYDVTSVDILKVSYYLTYSKLHKTPVIDNNFLSDLIMTIDDGYITNNYSDKVGVNQFTENISNHIDGCLKILKDYPDKLSNEFHFLMAALIEESDFRSNIMGSYESFYKRGWRKQALKDWTFNIIKNRNDTKNLVVNSSVESFLKNNKKWYNVVYADPPYNNRQYGSVFHTLETIATFYTGDVKGKINRPIIEVSSNFSKVKFVHDSFDNLFSKVSNITDTFYLSYNNEGLVSIEKMYDIGKRYFTDMKHQELLYRRFNTNQKNNKKKVYELLFKFQK